MSEDQAYGALARVLDSAPYAVLVLDASGRVVYANPRCYAFLQLDSHKPIDLETIESRLAGGNARELFRACCRNGGTRESMELELLDGSRVLEAHVNLLEDGRRNLTLIDVTPRRRAMTRLEIAHDNLERQVQDRTSELLAANKAKRDFLANMSHELRTPLNGILGMTDLALGTLLNDEQREYLQAVKASGRELLRIVNNLLDLASAESGRLVLKEREFQFRRVLASVARTMGEKARNKNLDFHMDIQDDLPSNLVGDPDRLRQVLANLLENGIKYTRRGGVRLEVDMRRAPQGGNAEALIHFAVSDTGTGIDPAKQEGVFESFSLGEELLTKKYSGAGLGLPICREIVRRMRGEIWFESQPGEGSVFHFTALFPLARRPQQQPAAPNGLLAPLRILLVEDDQVSGLYERFLLEKMGHGVTLAENGLLALDVLNQQSFDLVLMDIQMPEMDGLAATQAIRAGQAGVRAADLPIVALSVFAVQRDRDRFLKAGMDECVAKPVELERLKQAMAKALEMRSQDVDHA